MTSFDEVVILLHKYESNSKHTFFTLQVIFGCLLRIVSWDKRLILKEHLTIVQSFKLYLSVAMLKLSVSSQSIYDHFTSLLVS